MPRHPVSPLAPARWTCQTCSLRALAAVRQMPLSNRLSCRNLSTFSGSSTEQAINAAPEMSFDVEAVKESRMQPARIIPASPSYFTTFPNFNDHILRLQQFIRDYSSLPTVLPEQAPRMIWMNLAQFRSLTGEKVGAAKYSQVLQLLRRLNRIHPKLRPGKLQSTLEEFRRPGSADLVLPKPSTMDEFGRSKGVGRRKSSVARVSLVEGTGEMIINGRGLAQAFPRVHDRESALWPLKITNRLTKYNAFVLVNGGGLTGQAESVTLGLAKALIVQEPALKPALRKGGCVTRIMKRVERKKTGRVKARKRPTWVKR